MGTRNQGKREAATLAAINRRLTRWSTRDFRAEVEASVKNFARTVSSLSLRRSEIPGQMRALESAERKYRSAFGDFLGLVSVLSPPSLLAVEDEILAIASAKDDLEASSPRLRRFLEFASSHGDPRSASSARSYARVLADVGSQLPARARLRLLPVLEEINRLEHQYSRALEKEQKYVFFRSPSSLAGMPRARIRACRRHARSVGKTGWALPLEDTVEQEVGSLLRRPHSRIRLQRESASRGRRLAPLARQLAKARLRAARISGKGSWSRARAQFQASATPVTAWRLLRRLAGESVAKVSSPLSPPRALLVPSFDPLHVLERGCFFVARQLFGLRITHLPSVRMYHPSARLYRVATRSGRCVGFIAADLLRRPGKENGGWTSCWEDTASRTLLPVVGLFCNLDLQCSFSAAKDIFHEFGHTLHALLSSSNPVFSTALGMPNDLVEVPSMLAESWMLAPEVYERIKSPKSPSLSELTSHFSGPWKNSDRLADVLAAATDLVWHGSSLPSRSSSVSRIAMRKLGLARPPKTLPSYSEKLFPHIFCGGYDASFFSYLWCEERANLIAGWMPLGGSETPARAAKFARLLASGDALPSGDFCEPLGLA